MTLAGSSLVPVGASACLHQHGQRGARNDAENRHVRSQACGPHGGHVAVSGRSVDGDQTPVGARPPAAQACPLLQGCYISAVSPTAKIGDHAVYLVGVTGFEPVAPRSQSGAGACSAVYDQWLDGLRCAGSWTCVGRIAVNLRCQDHSNRYLALHG